MASVNPWTPQPASNLFDPPGGGSNFGRPAGNPLGQQTFWEQMGYSGGGNSSSQPRSSSGESSQGSSQGWQPQQGTVSTGGDYRQQLLQMLMGTNNNLNQAFGGAGSGGGGGWQHNYQPAYFPYANNSGLGFGGGTAGMFLRPQQYIPGTQTTWAGDLPQANNMTNWPGDMPFQPGYGQPMAAPKDSGGDADAVYAANRALRDEMRKKNPMLIGGDKDWRNIGKGNRNRSATPVTAQTQPASGSFATLGRNV